MNEEEKKSIEDMNRFANGIDMSCVTARQMQIILNLIKKLQKENEELKIKNNAIKRESEAYAEHMIRLDNELNLEKEKSKYEWIRQNCLPQELVNKLYIPIQKVKDKIEKYKKLSDKFYVKFLESDRYNTDIREKGIKCDAIILALEELIEERKVK